MCLLKSNLRFLPNNYFNEAVKETVSPHAWNIIGAVGLMILGVFLFFQNYFIYQNFLIIFCLPLILLAFGHGVLCLVKYFFLFQNFFKNANVESFFSYNNNINLIGFGFF